MNFLILSDSHGREINIERAVERSKELDAIFFLGDGLSDFDDLYRYKSLPLFCVRGNCDLFSSFSFSDVKDELVLRFEEYTVMLMHGHRYGVKSSLDAAAAHAANAGADILLYGHTHEPFERRLPSGSEVCGAALKKDLYLFNPGSIGSMNAGHFSFGTLTLKKNGILFGHGKLL